MQQSIFILIPQVRTFAYNCVHCKVLKIKKNLKIMHSTNPLHRTQTRHYSMDYLAGIQLLALGMHRIMFTISVLSLQYRMRL